MSMDFERALRARMDGKAKPLGALGRLERLAATVARVQGRLHPMMRSGTLMIFAADHGIADDGVSAFAASATRDMVATLAAGGAAVSVLARDNGLGLRVIDAGMRGAPVAMPEVEVEVEDRRIAAGTQSFAHGPAMTEAQCDAALDAGRLLAAEGGDDAMGFGELARGSSSSATLIVHRMTGVPLGGLVGRGAGLDDAGLFRKHEVLSAASGRVTARLEPAQVLQEYGGFEIAMMVGAMIGAARAQRIVLVDGYVSAAAALLAAQMAPECREAMVFSHLSREPGHQVALDAMAAKPLLTLDIAQGEGTGAALAWPLLRGAVAVLNGMADASGRP